MAKYGAVRPDADGSAFAPSAPGNNWVLEEIASHNCKIIEWEFGGETTTSTAMRTRIARDNGSVGSGARTSLTQSKYNPNSAAANAFVVSSYASTQPTAESGSLFGLAWNANGGAIRWSANPFEEPIIIGSSSIICRQVIGTANSTYGLVFAEDE